MSSASRRRLRYELLGLVPYERAEVMQNALREALARGDGEEHLLLLEHPHVYTLGRNARGEGLLGGEEAALRAGVAVAHTNRGGQVTYHGPGQLVGYPILDLKPDRKDVRRYVRDLMQVLIRTLADFGVSAEPGSGETIGVWTQGAKIASIGVHLSRWLTMHGFALNVTTDLGRFAGIVPCGLPDVTMASIESVSGRRYAVEEVAHAASRHFAEVFDRELIAPAEASAARAGETET